MKEILIMTAVMGSGGVEKALINMLNLLVKNQENNITVLLLKSGGSFISQIPTSITVKILSLQGISYENIYSRKSLKRIAFDGIRKFKFRKVIRHIYRKIVKKDYFYYLPEIDKAEILDPDLKKEYDLAICYHIHDAFNMVYVSQKVNAKKKIAWIHNDFNTTNFSIENFKSYIKNFDKFFAVSVKLKQEFCERLPEFSGKINVFYNIIPIEEIENLANAFYPKEYSKDEAIKILSIGRLNEQKGFDLAITVCKMLKEKQISFMWYIIGEGELREQLYQSTITLGLQNYIKFIGIRENPYPYMKNCDIYVQPSRHEGYATTISEAKVLCRPIVFTDVAGAREQLIDGVTGLIVPVDVNAIEQAICKLISDFYLRKNLRDNLRTENLRINSKNQLDELLKYLS